MTDRDSESVEAILARYRPAEAPAELLTRAERAATRRRGAWRRPIGAALSAVGETTLGVFVRGLALAITVIVLLLVSEKGY